MTVDMKELFVGREQELDHIRRLLNSAPSSFLLWVDGAGGVGKTSLVRQAERDLMPPSDYQVVLIDFDLPEQQHRDTLRRKVAELFRAVTRDAYHQKLNELRQAEHAGNVPELAKSLRAQCRATFEQGLAEPKPGPRRVLLCDTVERIRDTDVFEDLREILQQIDDVFVIIAGRNTPDNAIATALRATTDQNKQQFASLRVEPFEPADSDAFFHQALGDLVDRVTIQKLHILSGGKPLLLGLAATWLARRVPIDDAQLPPWRRLLTLPIKDIKTYKVSLQRSFEHELVGPLRELRSLENRAILYMALMNQPFDVETARTVLGVDEPTAAQIVEAVDKLFFVRANRTLQDVMRDLIVEHVWAEVDPDHSERRRLVSRLLELAQKRKDAAAEAPFRNFREAEELHYQLMLDIERGFDAFTAGYDKAIDKRDITRSQLLLQAIESPQHRERLTAEMRLEISVRRIELYRSLDLNNRVEQQYDRLLQQERDIPPSLKMAALATSAFMLRNREPERAIERYEAALRIAESLDDKLAIAEIKNYAGMVWRRLEEYERAASYLNDSIARFEALANWKLKAAAMNNLAYVYRQQMEPEFQDDALNWALQAYTIRDVLDDNEGLAYSHQTLGEIYRDRNELAKAAGNFEEARHLFDRLQMDRQMAQVDLALANIDRKEHRPQQAEETLKRVIAVFERLEDFEALAAAHNEYGCELRKRGRELGRKAGAHVEAQHIFRQAEEQFQLSLAYATRFRRNAYRRADDLADLALLYHYWLDSVIDAGPVDHTVMQELRRKAQDAAYGAIEIARDKKLRLIESRAMESLGDLYYCAERKYFKAFALFYLPACMVMAPYFRSELVRYRVVFDRVKRRLMSRNIDDAQVRFIARYMVRRWQEEGLNETAKGFADEFDWIVANWSAGAR